MTTSRNNTIMSWMAYTDFLSRLRIAAGILLPLNTRTLLLYPGGRDCIGAAGVDAYEEITEQCLHRQCSVIFIICLIFGDAVDVSSSRLGKEVPSRIMRKFICRLRQT